MRLCPHPVGRTTGFSHRVGASMANGLRPLYCPWSRCFVYHTIAWRGLHFALLCVARDLGWCDHEIIEALVGFCSPSYSGQGSSYVHWTTSLPSLYIRNIIPIRAPTGLSRVQSKPLPGRARISHPPARPDLIHPTSGNRDSANFAFWAFSEVHGPEKWPPGRCAPASCMLRYFCNVAGRRSDTLLSSAPLKKGG